LAGLRLAFLKSKVFKEVRKVATEVDKARDYIEHIKWLPNDLRRIVKDRIEWNIRRQGLDVDRHKWTEIFAKPSDAEIDGFFSKLVSMTINGPRNAIELMKRCINCAVENQEEKLGERHIDSVAPQYGGEVILDLSSSYSARLSRR
jgi:hypothetical protein